MSLFFKYVKFFVCVEYTSVCYVCVVCVYYTYMLTFLEYVCAEVCVSCFWRVCVN